MSQPSPTTIHRGWLACAAVAAASLGACGGGTDTQATQAAAQAVPATGSPAITAASIPGSAGSALAQPAFHVAPVLLDAPDDRDAADNAATAYTAPHTQAIPAELAGLSTRGLTVQTLRLALRRQAAAAPTAEGGAKPLAASGTVTTYTPAQIRAAYGLPALPAAGTSLSAAQAAQLGAGQTIYIVDAMHDPNAAAELAAFSQKFGLPGCTLATLAASSALPLPAASTNGCSFSVVYSTSAGTLSASAPAYDAGWATEIALDVQWVHATAPLARIVLIEAADASLNGLLGAVKLANAMGPGVVTMSFGSAEGNWTSSVDAAFTVPGMSYLAATGDNGAAVPWPAVSPYVLGVGGTHLNYSGNGPRSETAWSGTGGGISQYTPTPAYQNSAVPGIGVLAHRAVADLSFNADPSTGQFIAVMQPGSPAVDWLSVGGTSLATPQWAGLIAVANALRAQAGKSALGAPHALIYGQIGAVPGTYASAFDDITSGSNGSCAACTAKTGYDIPTGLGTPNATALLGALGAATSPASPAAPPPVVSSATVNGTAGSALSYQVVLSSTDAVSWALGGQPSGMSISSAGVLSWASPVAGSYGVTVTATDTKTGATGKGTLTIVIAKSQPPVISATALTGVAGKALSGTITITDAGASLVSLTISGAPAGMAFSVSGSTVAVRWPSPVVGKWSLAVSVKDSTGQGAQASVPVTIAAK